MLLPKVLFTLKKECNVAKLLPLFTAAAAWQLRQKTFAALFPTVVLSKLLRTYLISALRSRVKNTFRDQFKLESD